MGAEGRAALDLEGDGLDACREGRKGGTGGRQAVEGSYYYLAPTTTFP